MKKLLMILAALSLLVSTGWAQNEDNKKPEDQQSQVREGIEDLMENMPAEIKAQVKNAVQEAEAAKKQIQAMEAQGNNDEEIEAAMEQKKTQARERLQEAINGLNEMSEEAKGELKQLSEQIQDRLQERKAEFEEQQDQVKEQKGKE